MYSARMRVSPGEGIVEQWQICCCWMANYLVHGELSQFPAWWLERKRRCARTQLRAANHHHPPLQRSWLTNIPWRRRTGCRAGEGFPRQVLLLRSSGLLDLDWGPVAATRWQRHRPDVHCLFQLYAGPSRRLALYQVTYFDGTLTTECIAAGGHVSNLISPLQMMSIASSRICKAAVRGGTSP